MRSAARQPLCVGRALSYGESTSTFTLEEVVRGLVGDPIGPDRQPAWPASNADRRSPTASSQLPGRGSRRGRG